MATKRVRGGHVLQRTIREALRASNVNSLQVGFFKSARYPDGTQVAAVAAFNEFGTKNIPERPFFRQALRKSRDGVREIVATEIDSKKLEVGRGLAGQIGAHVAGEVQRRIVDLRDPPNAPITVARKGSSNPLVDTGQLRTSATWRVE